jgi:hypothetical protein
VLNTAKIGPVSQERIGMLHYLIAGPAAVGGVRPVPNGMSIWHDYSMLAPIAIIVSLIPSFAIPPGFGSMIRALSRSTVDSRSFDARVVLSCPLCVS